jgi:uncharacterized protein YggU (UPF0235/DUF167 family)
MSISQESGNLLEERTAPKFKGMRITVRAKPGSKRGNLVIPLADGSYEVHLKERPVDGKANGSLLKVIAEHFGVKAGSVTMVMGSTSRIKVLEIEKPA